MSNYQIPHDERPDYQVPVASGVDGDGCPQCGSHAIYPSDGTIIGRVPGPLQILQCARCGTRYRIRPKTASWRGLAREWSVLLGIALLVIVLLLIL